VETTWHAHDNGTRYSAVRPIDANVIKPGTYIGAAGTPTADGVKALEVMVFREERRGTGEGHHDWDLVPGSSMTNATVSAVTPVAGGRDLELTYQGNSLKLTLPDDVPIVTFAPADASDLKVGAPPAHPLRSLARPRCPDMIAGCMFTRDSDRSGMLQYSRRLRGWPSCCWQRCRQAAPGRRPRRWRLSFTGAHRQMERRRASQSAFSA